MKKVNAYYSKGVSEEEIISGRIELKKRINRLIQCISNKKGEKEIIFIKNTLVPKDRLQF